MATTVQYDAGAVRRLLTGPQGDVMKGLYRRGKRVETAAKRGCPVDHGRLRSSITTQFVGVGGTLAVRVGSDVSYALAVHNGTGIYGPRGVVIRPTHAKVLVWTNASGKKVGARYVKGVRGRPFLTDALKQVS